MLHSPFQTKLNNTFFLSFNVFFHRVHFLYVFPPKTPLRSSHLPTQPNSYTYYSKIKTHPKTKISEQNKNLIQNKHHGVGFMVSSCCWAWGRPGLCLVDLERLHRGELSSLSQQVEVAHSFLVRDGTLCPLPLFSAEILSVWTCAGLVNSLNPC